MKSGRWAVAWLRLVPLVWCPGACFAHRTPCWAELVPPLEGPFAWEDTWPLSQMGRLRPRGPQEARPTLCCHPEAHATQVLPFLPPGSVHCRVPAESRAVPVARMMSGWKAASCGAVTVSQSSRATVTRGRSASGVCGPGCCAQASMLGSNEKPLRRTFPRSCSRTRL